MKGATKFIFWCLVCCSIIICIIGIISPIFIKNTITHETLENLGPVGDWLGGSMTPFFTLTSTCLLVCTLIAQMTELKATREEFSKQSKEFEEQNRLISVQKFENTFFQMLSLNNQIVSSFTINWANKEYTGRNALEKWITFYGIDDIEFQYTRSEFLDSYLTIYNEYEHYLGHYFRNLYHIVNFVHTSVELEIFDTDKIIDFNSTLEQRKKYIRILRAQLSKNELLFIFYNSYTEQGADFQKLIIEYRILNNLRLESIPVVMRDDFIKLNQS